MSSDQTQPSKDSHEQVEQDSEHPPESRPRWFHAQGKSWALFSDKDDKKLEQKFQQLGGEEWAGKLGQIVENDAVDIKGKQRESDQQGKQEESSVPPSTSTIDKLRNSVGEWVPESISPSVSGNVTPSKDQKQTSTSASPVKEKKKPSSEKVVVNHKLDPSEPDSSPTRKAKVPVLEDNLFEVDLESMTLYPVFWKGVVLRVVRSRWFYSSNSDGSYAPIDFNSNLSKDLERAFAQVKPWKKNYKDRTQGLVDEDGDGKTDDKDKMLAKERLMTPLKKNKTEKEKEDEKRKNGGDEDGDNYDETEDGEVFFENESRGRIFTKDWRGRFMSVLGGSLVVRGFDEAERLMKKKSNNPFSNHGLPSFPMPWTDDDEEEEKKSDSEDQETKDQGNTRGARRAGRKAGAAKIPKRPLAGGGNEDEDQEPSNENASQNNSSFASKLWPSSDVLLKPGYAALRALGWSSEEAKSEEERKEKQGATEEALKGEGGGSGNQKVGKKDDKPISDGEEEEAGEEGEEIVEDLKDSPPELCLCLHGIGQLLSQDFDALSFVYDVQKLRNLSSKQASDPSIRKLSRGRRAQFLPICWRAGLSFDERPDGNDNYFTLDDVNNDAAIPMVRTIISKVILDVPFYLSNHRAKMIRSVRNELNRVYRLFCKRNPNFEKDGGRVNLICHSLGSALAADILADQPTFVKPLKDLSEDELKSNENLLFNVKDTFLIGSPLGFFCYLESVQLIARRGTLRTSKDKEEFNQDSALDVVGRKGCLATETLYNIYNTTDPVAYQISACCDSVYAKMLNPVPISSAVSAILESLEKPRLSVSKVFKGFGSHPFSGVGSFASQDTEEMKQDRKEVEEENQRTQSEEEEKDEKEEKKEGNNSEENKKDRPQLQERKLTLERGSSLKKRQAKAAAKELQRRALEEGADTSGRWDAEALARAERRFKALNPHGILDFTIESDGFNAYIDAIGAHMSYWTSPTFSTFVLSQLFLRQDENRGQTSIGDEMPSVVPELKAGEDKELKDEGEKEETDGKEKERK